MTARYFSSIQPTAQSSGHGGLSIGLGLCVPISVACFASLAHPIAIAQTSAKPLLLAQSIETTATSVLYVNPISGNDTTADGSDRAPFKTLTRALDVALPNTIIQLAPGTYSAATGEVFPIALKPRVIVQGNPETRGQEVVIRGGGVFSSPALAQQNIAVLGGANGSSLIGVTVTNPNGYGVQIESSSPTIANSTLINNGRGGIVLVGNSTALIRNNFFSQNGDSSIRLHGNTNPTIQENIIEQSDKGISISDAAAPLIVNNRITQNKTGIAVQGQAQPKLRGNSVEGNEGVGLLAIAKARPDLGSESAPDANFFRNNGKKDIALEPQSPSSAPVPTAATPAPKPQLPAKHQPSREITHKSAVIGEKDQAPTKQPGGFEASVPAPSVVKDKQPVNSDSGSTSSAKTAETTVPPTVVKDPGAIVVPVIKTQKIQPVPSVTFGDQVPAISIEPKASPSGVTQPPKTPNKPIPSIPKASPQNSVPQPTSHSNPASSSISATAFPVPTALSNTNLKPTPSRPIQVIQLNSLTPPSDAIGDVASSEAEMPVAIVKVSPAPRSGLPPASVQAIAPEPRSNPTTTPVRSRQRIPMPLPAKLPTEDEIPAPPTFAPRPAAPQPIVPIRAVNIQPQSPSASFPIPEPVNQSPIRLAPRVMPSVQTPVPVSVTPEVATPSRSIVIPVPPPDRDRPIVPTQTPRRPASSPIPPFPVANKPAPAKAGNLLPVPGPNIPVGNIGDMPSVYSARGNQQSIPGLANNAGSVVVKYRVVVVAIDDTQQEQIRSIVPDAFPVVYRGQRVLQAGAFGDRSKADQLVASLNTQGLQAIIEPLE